MYRGAFFIIWNRSITLAFVFFCCLALTGCGRVETVIRGETMGTTYSIKLMTGRWSKTAHLSALIEERLHEINASLSTFIENSEISIFNGLPANEVFAPSADFLAVMRVAQDIYKLSDGAWDGSLDPLIRLWGFGRETQKERVPSPEEITAGLSLVDFSKISISSDGKLSKSESNLTIDLSSIAKGYGVDSIAALLKEQEYKDFLIEIGGEIFASGKKGKNTLWRVGINTPSSSAGSKNVYKVLSVSEKGVATSGNYRNYFGTEERTYSHILDPRTGYPVTNGVVSISVIAETCTVADGLATALMVMGHGAGLELVEQLPNVEAFFVVRKSDGKFEEFASSSFKKIEL